MFGQEIEVGDTILFNSGSFLFKYVVKFIDDDGKMYYDVIVDDLEPVSVMFESECGQFVKINDIINCNPELFI